MIFGYPKFKNQPGWGCAGPALAGASTTAVNTQVMRPADFEQLWPYGYMIIIGIFPIQWQFEKGWMSKNRGHIMMKADMSR